MGQPNRLSRKYKTADSGQGWSFSDPQRVAVESLKPFYAGEVPILRSVKKTSSPVFQWKNDKRAVVVVVIRPYWLSFYAASDSVAWVTTTIKEAGCQ